MMQNKWSSILNPVIALPINNGVILSGVVLTKGTNVINTTLGRQAQGWFICDSDSPVNVYRSAPFNNLNLTLISNADATVNLMVF